VADFSNLKTSPDRIERAENASRALELRLRGLNFEQIGREMGFSRQRAHALVTEEVARVNGERNASATILRNLEAERLDRLQAAVWPRAVEGDLKALDRVLSIMSRRARLLGIDAQLHTVPADEARALVRALVAAVKDCVSDPDTPELGSAFWLGAARFLETRGRLKSGSIERSIRPPISQPAPPWSIRDDAEDSSPFGASSGGDEVGGDCGGCDWPSCAAASLPSCMPTRAPA
jgi:hypothetical protein